MTSTPPTAPNTTAENNNDVGSMIATHTLATSIMTRHGTSDPVLDAHELTMLKEFCNDPSQKDAILAKYGMMDPGLGWEKKGSLVGFLIARHETSTPGLTGAEVQALREWFEGNDVLGV